MIEAGIGPYDYGSLHGLDAYEYMGCAYCERELFPPGNQNEQEEIPWKRLLN